MTTEGLEAQSFDEAVVNALAELESANPSETQEALPAALEEEVLVEDQAVVEPSVEDPDGESSESTELFEDLVLEEEEPQAVDLDSLTFTLPGVDGPVTLQELQAGYLRQSDATRKWQAAADLRKTNEQAIQFWEALQTDPVGVVQQLAAEAGIIEPGQAPVRKVDISAIKTAEDMETEVQRRVQEAVAQHPDVQKAFLVTAEQAIGAEFARIETERGVQLGPKSRIRILEEASRRGVPDLELVFDGLLAQVERSKQTTQALKNASPGHSTGGKGNVVTEVKPAGSVEEAFSRALVELQS